MRMGTQSNSIESGYEIPMNYFFSAEYFKSIKMLLSRRPWALAVPATGRPYTPCGEPCGAAAEVGAADQAKDASDEAETKPWNSIIYLLVFSPEHPECSEYLQEDKHAYRSSIHGFLPIFPLHITYPAS